MEKVEFEDGEVNRFDDEELDEDKKDAIAIEVLKDLNENGELKDTLEENN